MRNGLKIYYHIIIQNGYKKIKGAYDRSEKYVKRLSARKLKAKKYLN